MSDAGSGTLAGRVALVTGGRGGAGRAVCERFVAEGAHVYAADLSDAGSIDDASAAGEFLRFDVTSETEVEAEARCATGQLWVLDGGLSVQIQQLRS